MRVLLARFFIFLYFGDFVGLTRLYNIIRNSIKMGSRIDTVKWWIGECGRS